MDYELDDPHSEAAAFRHAAPSGPFKPRAKYKPAPDDVTLRIRVSQTLFSQLLEISKNEDRGIEGYCRKLLKKDVRFKEWTLRDAA